MSSADDRYVATDDPLGHRLHRWQDPPGRDAVCKSIAVGRVEAAAP